MHTLLSWVMLRPAMLCVSMLCCAMPWPCLLGHAMNPAMAALLLLIADDGLVYLAPACSLH